MLSPSVTRTLLSHLGNDEMTDRRRFAAQRLTSLTDREREVATAVGSGASNAEVAASLFMSEATVKAHVSRLLTKLAVTNRVHIAISCTTLNRDLTAISLKRLPRRAIGPGRLQREVGLRRASEAGLGRVPLGVCDRATLGARHTTTGAALVAVGGAYPAIARSADCLYNHQSQRSSM